EPYRVFEAIWPDAFGRFGPENRSWIQALPTPGERQLWTPSLYLGGLTLALAAAGMSSAGKSREAPAWPVWVLLVGTVALAASFGKFGGPLWWARWIPSIADVIGPHDPLRRRERLDGLLPDGAASAYGVLAVALPAFSLFRYPAKLLPIVALAV